MCGIVGVVALRDIPVPEESVLATAARAIAHRGPDDSGTWRAPDGSACFAHRRLSILDLSPLGHQPWTSADGRYVMTYNGEIYNFRELRTELESRGHTFRSRSDTEVVLEAVREWGDAAVGKLRGMFAFGIWDAVERRLLLARDRLGIKPLYWYSDDQQIAFASELSALEALPGLRLDVDRTALVDYLTYLYVPAPKSPYVRVRKLLPASTLVAHGGRLESRIYWEVDPTPRAGPVDEADAAMELRDRLEEAVDAHMVADVPVGSLLSGGIDSSAVTALAQRRSPFPMKTFSIGFDVEEHTETHFARQLAKFVGTDHVERCVAVDEARDMVPHIVGLYGEPFADSSAFPTFVVSRLAREQVTVALSGDGGDEVFGGYNWYSRHLRRQRFFGSAPKILREHLPALLEGSSLRHLRGVPTVIDGLRPDLERHVAIMGGFTRAQKQKLLAPKVAREFRDYDDLWAFRPHWRADLPLLTRLQVLDLNTYLPDDILAKVDRASMAVSLELRPPLLDHRLIEWVFGLPERIRNPGGALKHIFKASMRGILPDAILDRSKKGFSIPLDRWVGALLAGDPKTPMPVHPTQRWIVHVLRRWEQEHASSSILWRGAEASRPQARRLTTT